MPRKSSSNPWWAVPLEMWELVTRKPVERTKEMGILSYRGKRFVLITRSTLARTFSQQQRASILKASHPITARGIRFPARRKPK